MMAEGVTRLNQQVVGVDHWRAERPVGQATPEPSQPSSELRAPAVHRAVEADILPRVLMTRGRGPGAGMVRSQGGPITEAEILGFVKLLLTGGSEAQASAHVAAVQARGVSIDLVYLNLFQPAARHIGELWADDLCTFVDVTLAVGTMQMLLRVLAPEFHRNGRPVQGERQAILMPSPGDQHTFGLSMVVEFFRRAGWSVCSLQGDGAEQLGEAVQRSWFAVVGFSAGNADRIDDLAAMITMVRRLSCNRAVGIMVGGPLFVEHPEYAAQIGADAVGTHATDALARAESFVALPTGP